MPEVKFGRKDEPATTLRESDDLIAVRTRSTRSLVVEILHTYIGDLKVTLYPPAGAGIVLHDRGGGPTRNLKRTYDVLTVPDLGAFAGKAVKGRWTLQIEDTAVRDEGTLLRYGLELTFPPSVPRIEIGSRGNGAASRRRTDRRAVAGRK